MTTNRVVADDTVKGSRFYRILSKILAILAQVRQDEYPYDPEDLDKHLQDAHDGIFAGQWAHPLHFMLVAQQKNLLRRYESSRPYLAKWFVEKFEAWRTIDENPAHHYRDHLSVVTDVDAMLDRQLHKRGTMASIDEVLPMWGLDHATIMDLWAISLLRLPQRNLTIFAAGGIREVAITAGKPDGLVLPGFNLSNREFTKVVLRPERPIRSGDGVGLLVLHKTDPWHLSFF